MKRFMQLSLIIMLTMGMSSCGLFKTKVLPKLKQEAAKKLVEAVVKVGECQAVDVVKDDVYKLLKLESNNGVMVKALGSSTTESSQRQSLVSEICKAAAKLALPVLLSKGVPERWDCKLTDLNSKMGDLAQKACGKIPL